ncbi:hypothetical protein CVT25_006595 [Psilocybe cyanescens]|uniref:Uncharacterized protein n=1 Tax=Psilocybe cyanescens TaxID=93625 RepID=A0A409XIM4_PSICY|nr:hypothetical protein CVT25_006595 [Psilocybe cyanescens]
MFSKKRRRITARQVGAYHDSVQILNDFDIIHSSEGTLQNVGGTTRAARIDHSPERVAGAWEQVTSWSPPDDENFALNADEEWYNETVEAEVMEEWPRLK